MSLTIPVAHDFICPWCWVGLLQARILQQEFAVSIEWKAFELFPDELEWPNYPPAPPPPANQPPVLSRFEFLLAADQVEMPTAERPKRMRSHNAHEAVEYAKTEGVHVELVERLYRAYWQEGREINSPSVLGEIAEGLIENIGEMQAAIAERRFKDQIVGFDDPAYAIGIYNVPTFYIGDGRFAEQPLTALRKAMASLAVGGRA